MNRISEKFDRQLFVRKLLEPSCQMQIESLASIKATRSAKLAGSVLIRIVDGQLTVLRNWLKTVDRICREVWQSQRGTITPEFVHKILLPEAMTAIATRVGVVNSCVDRAAAQTREGPSTARRHLAMEVNRLKAEIANSYEIAVRELEYGSVPTKTVVRDKEKKLGQGLAVEAEFLAKHEESAPRISTQQNGQENSSARAEQPHPTLKRWQEIKITFLSDNRIEVCWGATEPETYNYGEFGFEDRRSGKPNLAWIMLRELSKEGGTRPQPPAGKTRAKEQKRIEEIREHLKNHFKIDTDPIPFNGSEYKTSFKIGRKPSFDT